MELNNECYNVKIDMKMENRDINEAYKLAEENEKELIQLDNVLDNDQWRLYEITVSDGTNNETIYLLGSPYSAVDNCFVLSGDRLKVLNDNYLLDIDLDSLEVMEKIEILDYSTGVEMLPYLDGCLIHGENELIRVDEDNNSIWSFSGKNLFLSNDDGPRVLEVENDIIKIRDLYGNQYLLNSMGEEI